ncbi:AzlC family ABC transporter permease [Acinetobacter nectaris]|uniref:AzlC family ABC transporter permease n=1 Tax=Acinetobacter nectaris TaxID=1219382 RepID=UPI001F311BBF|nr:AzlC family ABC transporter permease [Acinetobacter nectaris]MCF9046897.1 AzlC family ABC transporter permease [Acinetobacter nectaris]
MLTSRNTSQTLYETSDFVSFKRGIKMSIPVLLGIIPFALVLGTQATQKGFSTLEIPLLTGLNFAGGSEFAILELWTNPPQIMMLIFITFLVNSRHLLMGASLVPYLKHLPNKKVLPALFFMCDESWAMGIADAKRNHRHPIEDAFNFSFYAGLCFSLYIMWVAFTTLGGVIGSVLGDITRWGFDMAFPAVFLVLLRGMWTGVRNAIPWLISLIGAIIAYLYLPQGWYVPVGAISGIVAAIIMTGDEK